MAKQFDGFLKNAPAVEPATLLRGVRPGDKSRDNHKCLLCENNVAATIHDFRFDEEHTQLDYDVCANHLTMLALLCLEPASVLKLRKLAKGDVFWSHDDFYDEDGNALQPKG